MQQSFNTVGNEYSSHLRINSKSITPIAENTRSSIIQENKSDMVDGESVYGHIGIFNSYFSNKVPLEPKGRIINPTNYQSSKRKFKTRETEMADESRNSHYKFLKVDKRNH